MLSAALHFLVGMFVIMLAPVWVRSIVPQPHPTPLQFVTLSDATSIARRAVPLPRNVPRNAGHPAHPRVVPVHPAQAHPLAQAPKPISRPTSEPTPRPRPEYSLPPTPAPIEKTPAPRAIAQAPRSSSAFTSEQLAQMQRDFDSEIAAARGSENPLRVPPATPAAPKHYSAAMTGLTRELNGEQGLCYPIRQWYSAGYDYYYVSCNVVHTDGTYAHEAVPWPIRFLPYADPFNGSYPHQSALPGPLPGWRPPSGVVMSEDLGEYARAHGGSW